MQTETPLELQIIISPNGDAWTAMLLVPRLGLNAGPYPFTPPLDDAGLADLRWYLEQYPHWPSGSDFQRAADIEDQLEGRGHALFDAAFASRDAPLATIPRPRRRPPCPPRLHRAACAALALGVARC